MASIFDEIAAEESGPDEGSVPETLPSPDASPESETGVVMVQNPLSDSVVTVGINPLAARSPDAATPSHSTRKALSRPELEDEPSAPPSPLQAPDSRPSTPTDKDPSFQNGGGGGGGGGELTETSPKQGARLRELSRIDRDLAVAGGRAASPLARMNPSDELDAQLQSASGLVRTLAQLECPLCGQFYKQPMRLHKCDHVLCMSCAKNLMRVNQDCNVPKRQRFITCPTCRMVTRLRDNPWRMDQTVETRVDAVQEKLKGIVVYDACSICSVSYDPLPGDDSPTQEGKQPQPLQQVLTPRIVGPRRQPVKTCLDCSAHFCEKCLHVHPTRGKYKTHVLVPYEPSPPPPLTDCPDHNHKKVTLWCLPCQQLVCTLCAALPESPHHTHERVHIREAAADSLRLLTRQLRRAIGWKRGYGVYEGFITGLQQSLQDAAAQAHTALDAEVEKLAWLLKHRATVLHRAIDQEVSDRTAVLSQHRSMCSQIHRAVTSCTGRVREIVSLAGHQPAVYMRMIDKAQALLSGLEAHEEWRLTVKPAAQQPGKTGVSESKTSSSSTTTTTTTTTSASQPSGVSGSSANPPAPDPAFILAMSEAIYQLLRGVLGDRACGLRQLMGPAETSSSDLVDILSAGRLPLTLVASPLHSALSKMNYAELLDREEGVSTIVPVATPQTVSASGGDAVGGGAGAGAGPQPAPTTVRVGIDAVTTHGGSQSHCVLQWSGAPGPYVLQRMEWQDNGGASALLDRHQRAVSTRQNQSTVTPAGVTAGLGVSENETSHDGFRWRTVHGTTNPWFHCMQANRDGLSLPPPTTTLTHHNSAVARLNRVAAQYGLDGLYRLVCGDGHSVTFGVSHQLVRVRRSFGLVANGMENDRWSVSKAGGVLVAPLSGTACCVEFVRPVRITAVRLFVCTAGERSRTPSPATGGELPRSGAHSPTSITATGAGPSGFTLHALLPDAFRFEVPATVREGLDKGDVKTPWQRPVTRAGYAVHVAGCGVQDDAPGVSAQLPVVSQCATGVRRVLGLPETVDEDSASLASSMSALRGGDSAVVAWTGVAVPASHDAAGFSEAARVTRAKLARTQQDISPTPVEVQQGGDEKDRDTASEGVHELKAGVARSETDRLTAIRAELEACNDGSAEHTPAFPEGRWVESLSADEEIVLSEAPEVCAGVRAVTVRVTGMQVGRFFRLDLAGEGASSGSGRRRGRNAAPSFAFGFVGEYL